MQKIRDDGFGVKQNYSEALKFFKMAVDRNDPDGMTHVSTLYPGGVGVSLNVKTAFHFARMAADLNDGY
jgi:TPR repeat protein